MTVQAVDYFSPYSTASAMFAALPTWMSDMDGERVSAYQVYEQIYWNVPDTFKLIMRGDEDLPIYIPTGRTIVDTTSRYLCPGPGFIIDADAGAATDQEIMRRAVSALFRRERFWSKFVGNKRMGVMRGDWCWHIIGNPVKNLGRRISIEALDPASYFPVYAPNDDTKIIAVYIVEQYTDADGKVTIKRQTYQKGADPINNDGSDTTIYNSIGLFDLEAWQSLGDQATTVLKPPTALPPEITALPVYHIRNLETPGDPFGSSELRGFERIMSAVNQAISDEEVILALEGLGMYETDGGPPRDANGNITDWLLGPGRVVEHPTGSSFARVTGVSSVQPMQDHLSFLINALKEASATPDAAIGKVDVTVAESGISLTLQLGPLLAKVGERKEPVVDVLTQMYHDICQQWFPAYEELDSVCAALPVFDEPVPVNTDDKFAQIMAIFAAGLGDSDWARGELGKLGYDFDPAMAAQVLNELQAKSIATDPFASRLASEVDDEGPTPEGSAGEPNDD